MQEDEKTPETVFGFTVVPLGTNVNKLLLDLEVQKEISWDLLTGLVDRLVLLEKNDISLEKKETFTFKNNVTVFTVKKTRYIGKPGSDNYLETDDAIPDQVSILIPATRFPALFESYKEKYVHEMKEMANHHLGWLAKHVVIDTESVTISY